jgi:hypothetical protein
MDTPELIWLLFLATVLIFIAPALRDLLRHQY